MKPRVFIETTIPSFYFEERTEPSMIARREWTQLWWDTCRFDYTLCTSVAVLEELEEGEHPHKSDTLCLLNDIDILLIDNKVIEIVDNYIFSKIMPNDPKGDALHLAVASYHSCQFLLTWNCSHLANSNKAEHIRHVNNLLGLFTPILTTPMELLKE